MTAKLEFIRDGLHRLRTAKRLPRIFGAEAHRFELNPPLTDAVVRKFERKHHIRLPDDYRGFLIELGNGGAGPFYGVFKLGERDYFHDDRPWKERDGFIGVLSQPFPHQKAWNDLKGRPKPMDDEAAYDKALEAFEERYRNSANVNGAIPLCHHGCAYRDWLIVTGTEAGNMWYDGRADQRGLRPIAIGRKKRVTFLEWYLDWLSATLARLPKPRA